MHRGRPPWRSGAYGKRRLAVVGAVVRAAAAAVVGGAVVRAAAAAVVGDAVVGAATVPQLGASIVGAACAADVGAGVVGAAGVADLGAGVVGAVPGAGDGRQRGGDRDDRGGDCEHALDLHAKHLLVVADNRRIRVIASQRQVDIGPTTPTRRTAAN